MVPLHSSKKSTKGIQSPYEQKNKNFYGCKTHGRGVSEKNRASITIDDFKIKPVSQCDSVTFLNEIELNPIGPVLDDDIS